MEIYHRSANVRLGAVLHFYDSDFRKRSSSRLQIPFRVVGLKAKSSGQAFLIVFCRNVSVAFSLCAATGSRLDP